MKRVVFAVVALMTVSMHAVPAHADPPVVIEQPQEVHCFISHALTTQVVGRLGYGTGDALSLCSAPINTILQGVNVWSATSTQVDPNHPRAATAQCDECYSVRAITDPPLEALLPACFSSVAGAAWGGHSRQTIDGTPITTRQVCIYG